MHFAIAISLMSTTALNIIIMDINLLTLCNFREQLSRLIPDFSKRIK
jgi:hypothetical protein